MLPSRVQDVRRNVRNTGKWPVLSASLADLFLCMQNILSAFCVFPRFSLPVFGVWIFVTVTRNKYNDLYNILNKLYHMFLSSSSTIRFNIILSLDLGGRAVKGEGLWQVALLRLRVWISVGGCDVCVVCCTVKKKAEARTIETKKKQAGKNTKRK